MVVPLVYIVQAKRTEAGPISPFCCGSNARRVRAIEKVSAFFLGVRVAEGRESKSRADDLRCKENLLALRRFGP